LFRQFGTAQASGRILFHKEDFTPCLNAMNFVIFLPTAKRFVDFFEIYLQLFGIKFAALNL